MSPGGLPVGDPQLIPSLEVLSGYPDVATDCSAYYVTWMDGRLNGEYIDIFAKKIGTVISSVGKDESKLPQAVTLYPVYPNPFNPGTMIRFAIPEQMHVSLGVYDMVGREVATVVNEELPPGEYSRAFNADGLASGVYLYRLRAGNFMETRRFTLVK